MFDIVNIIQKLEGHMDMRKILLVYINDAFLTQYNRKALNYEFDITKHILHVKFYRNEFPRKNQSVTIIYQKLMLLP